MAVSDCIEWPGRRDNGYPVRATGKDIYVHREVLAAKLGRPVGPKMDVGMAAGLTAALALTMMTSAAIEASVSHPGPWHRETIAPWFGGTDYGQPLACGGHLTRWTRGVAHRRLPCGTRLELRWHGHRVVTRVVDRGPYPRRVGLSNRLMHLDLTARTMHDLTGRFSTTHHLRWRVVPRYGDWP